jgi:hypothetical protein
LLIAGCLLAPCLLAVTATPLHRASASSAKTEEEVGLSLLFQNSSMAPITLMEQSSHFRLVPSDDAGNPVGPVLIAHAGEDDRWRHSDDGFVRRFDVRQIARGCPAVGDTTGATFTVQGLVQLRDALHPEERRRRIPAETTQLSLEWSQQPGTYRTVQVKHAKPGDFPFGFGFRIQLEVASPPANGQYFMPGETVSIRVTFRDGAGSRLFPPGTLPAYGAFLRGAIATAGLRYFDFSLNDTLYYALKHRESNLLLTLSGPTNSLKTPTLVVDSASFLPTGQATVAAVPSDGYSAVATTIPPPGILLGGLFNPALWETPFSDTFSLVIPADALPGTYVVAIKARRNFGGETLNRAKTLSVQVGTAIVTSFSPKTGNCNDCHHGPSRFEKILHGISDRRACFACHASITTEPDGALDIRVHEIHDRSERFRSVGGDVQKCGLCHLVPPTAPARGLLGGPPD